MFVPNKFTHMTTDEKYVTHVQFMRLKSICTRSREYNALLEKKLLARERFKSIFLHKTKVNVGKQPLYEL